MYIFTRKRNYVHDGAQDSPTTNGAQGKYNTRSKADTAIGPCTHGFGGFLHMRDIQWTLFRLEERYPWRVVRHLYLYGPGLVINVLYVLLV
jgi:hypothetical protein